MQVEQYQYDRTSILPVTWKNASFLRCTLKAIRSYPQDNLCDAQVNSVAKVTINNELWLSCRIVTCLWKFCNNLHLMQEWHCFHLQNWKNAIYRSAW